MNDYYNNPAISQSKLKLLLGDPNKFNTVEEPELYFEEKKYFVIGSAVDFCLTQPNEEFNNYYHISNLENKPSDTIRSIINQVFDIVVEDMGIEEVGIIQDYYGVILLACNEHNYQSRWNDQTRINKVCEAWEYWEDLKDSRGKQVLSLEEKNLIDRIVMSIRTNEATSEIFNQEGIKYQVALYFEYEGVDCKALLDMIIVDEENKRIQPIDIKTMGENTLSFPISLRRRRYDIQAAFYTEALQILFPDYVILPFMFIVESTINPGNPLIYVLSSSLLNIGKNGRPFIHLEGTTGELTNEERIIYGRIEEIKGFHQLIELYKYYTENGFEKDQIVRENKSELIIDWSGVTERIF